MANNPISMNRIRQIVRLHHQGHSNLIASQTGISRNTLKKYLKIYKSCGQGFETAMWL